jgi:hypothetical protein
LVFDRVHKLRGHHKLTAVTRSDLHQMCAEVFGSDGVDRGDGQWDVNPAVL